MTTSSDPLQAALVAARARRSRLDGMLEATRNSSAFTPGRQVAGCLSAKADKGCRPGSPEGRGPSAEEADRAGLEAERDVMDRAAYMDAYTAFWGGQGVSRKPPSHLPQNEDYYVDNS